MRIFALTALSMALGWRIRGQFGHEAGAAIPGALGALALALASSRPDWLARAPYFALLGGLGWSFGGSISYMKVIGYTHSSDSATVLYGFAGVFLIGFLWAALGAAGTALAATLDDKRLNALFPALAAVFAAWLAQDILLDLLRAPASGGPLGERVADPGGLARFDADWPGATAALLAALLLTAVRRRFDAGISLVIHLALGWWTAFFALVVVAGLRLNPPRGDNWAGCLGLAAGMLVWTFRQRLPEIRQAMLITGILGGAGFCLGQMAKLGFWWTGANFGWHAVMEWIHGALFGVALVIGMRHLGGAPAGTAALRAWTTPLAVWFTLCAIPYLNFRRSPAVWMRNVKSLPDAVYGLPLVGAFSPSKGFLGWYELLYLFLSLLLVLWARRGGTLSATPLHLVLTWIAVFHGFAHEVAQFNPIVWALSFGIAINAVLCTYLVMTPSPTAWKPHPSPRLTAIAALATILIVAGWAWQRSLFQGTHAPGFYMDHIRFGERNTNDRR